MARRTREERRAEILAAAEKMVQASAVNWASSVTFGALAAETSIDQAQIARDFGSKDELAADLIRHLFRPDAFAHFDDHVGEFVENITEFESLAETLTVWGQANDEINRGNVTKLRTEFLIWATTQAGSVEWRTLADLRRGMLDQFTSDATQMLESAIEGGATLRNDLTPQEFVLALTCVVEGLTITHGLSPDLIPEGLTARIVIALASAVVGPDEDGPLNQLARTPMA